MFFFFSLFSCVSFQCQGSRRQLNDDDYNWFRFFTLFLHLQLGFAKRWWLIICRITLESSLSLSLFLRHFSVLTEVEAVLMVVLHLDICFQWANRLKNIRYFIYFFVALLSSESWWFFSLHKNSCNKNHSIWKKRWLMVRLVRACGDEESKEPRELLFFISFDQGWQNQSIFVLKRVFSSGPTLKCTGYHIHF